MSLRTGATAAKRQAIAKGSIDKLHRNVVAAATKLRSIQNVAKREMDIDDTISKDTRQAAKDVRRTYHMALSDFQSAIEKLDIPDRPANLEELYDKIGHVDMFP